MLDSQIRQMQDDFARRMQSQGLSMEQYMQFTGTTMEQLNEQMKPQALKRIQSRLVLEKIAEVEDVQVSDEKIDEEIAKMAEMYNMEVEKLKELMGDYEKDQMKKDMAVQEAVTLVTEAAKEV
jgi:trigger factor